MRPIGGQTLLAGVVGTGVRRSLSPVIHNAWIAAAGIDAVYVAFQLQADAFAAFATSLRGAAVRGLNVTIPFKEEALAIADVATPAAMRAGAANVLTYGDNGGIGAANTDGLGLQEALASAGYVPTHGPAVVVGAGGAARGAAVSLLEAGAPEVRLVNRTRARADEVARALGPRASSHALADVATATEDAAVVINAAALGGEGQPALDLPPAPARCIVMDMVYRPLETPLLAQARQAGHPIADGLAMLIAQARPSFQAFFDQAAPDDVDVRTLCEAELASPA